MIVGGDNVARRDTKDPKVLPNGKPMVSNLLLLFVKKYSTYYDDLTNNVLFFLIGIILLQYRFLIVPSTLSKESLRGYACFLRSLS